MASCSSAVRPITDKPLIVKLTPNASDVAAVARAAEQAGASAVSLINTIRGMALHPRTGEPWLGRRTGGVSGPAVRAVALAQVRAVAGAVAIPVVGMGGVQSGRDARDLMRVGADIVAVGTESFRDPAAGLRIASELHELRTRKRNHTADTYSPKRRAFAALAASSTQNPLQTRLFPEPSSTMLDLKLRSSRIARIGLIGSPQDV